MRLLAIAWQGVRGFPVRTTLTALGLMVGIVSLVSVVSATATTVATVEQRALLTGGPTATFDISGLTGSRGLARSQEVLSQLRASVAQDLMGVRFARTEVTSLELSGKVFDADVVFTEPTLADIRPFPVVLGSWLSEPTGTGVGLVLNQAAYDATQGPEGGKVSLRVQGNASRVPTPVTGVVNDGNSRPTAYAHLDYLPVLVVNQEALIKTTLEISSPQLTNQAIQARLNELDDLTGVTTPWGIARRDTVGQLATEVTATRSSFMAVGILGLLATAFAVANVGLSALRERSAELSLRRALGGRRWQIPGLMILESQIVGMLAGAMAVPVSYLLYPFVAEQFGAPYGITAPPYPWASALVGLCIGMLTALIGSLAPAIRALNTPISSMMRE